MTETFPVQIIVQWRWGNGKKQIGLHGLAALSGCGKLANVKVTRPSFFGGVPSYFEALWYPHLYFYRRMDNT